MEHIKMIAQKMEAMGMTEDEIAYALKPLEPLPEALAKLLDTFDNTYEWTTVCKLNHVIHI